MTDKRTIFLTGYAKLPEGITAWELYRIIALGILLDKETGEILDADCTLSTRVAHEFIRDLLVGENLNCLSDIEHKIIDQYFGSAKKALMTALRICYKNYKQIKGRLL